MAEIKSSGDRITVDGPLDEDLWRPDAEKEIDSPELPGREEQTEKDENLEKDYDRPAYDILDASSHENRFWDSEAMEFVDSVSDEVVTRDVSDVSGDSDEILEEDDNRRPVDKLSSAPDIDGEIEEVAGDGSKGKIYFASAEWDSLYKDTAPILSERGYDVQRISSGRLRRSDPSDYNDGTVVLRPGSLTDDFEDNLWDSLMEMKDEGVNFVNDPAFARVFEDKKQAKNLIDRKLGERGPFGFNFGDKDIRTPETYSSIEAIQKTAVEGVEVVAKPNRCSWQGRGVRKLNSRDEVLDYIGRNLNRNVGVDDLLSDRELLERVEEEILFEEHIDKTDNSIQEKRMYFTGGPDGGYSVVMDRDGGGFAQNIHQGASYSESELSESEIKVHRKLGKLDNGFLGDNSYFNVALDYLYDNDSDEVIALEPNGAAGHKIGDYVQEDFAHKKASMIADAEKSRQSSYIKNGFYIESGKEI